MRMLTKPQAIYDDTNETALGYQNHLYIRKAQRIQPFLYDGNTLAEKHASISVIDSEETLILAKESRLKIKTKQDEHNDKPIDYSKLNKLYEYFVPQKQISAEQAYWLPVSEPFVVKAKPKLIVPKQLPKTRIKSYTYASGSKPRSNTRNDRIQRPPSRSQKNKVEVQPRKYCRKYSLIFGLWLSLSKKTYRIYNKRTRMIMETINVQFDKLTQMASKQFSSRLEPQSLTFGQISSGLVPNSAPSTSSNLPSKKDLDILFQLMFDEYFKPSPSAISLTISAATLPQDTTGETSLIFIDHDAPSPSTTPNTKTISTLIQDANVEEPNQENA
ncbi:hypothetical protein Tco_1439537 [Tanacetum coccineum]